MLQSLVVSLLALSVSDPSARVAIASLQVIHHPGGPSNVGYYVLVAPVALALLGAMAFGFMLINYAGVSRKRRLALVAGKTYLPAAEGAPRESDVYILSLLTERKITEQRVSRALFHQVNIGNPVRVVYAQGRILRKEVLIELETYVEPVALHQETPANETDFVRERVG